MAPHPQPHAGPQAASHPPPAGAGGVSYPDLRAVVYSDHVPAGAADELPALYNTLLSTVDWFDIVDEIEPTGACILEQPHHVILFHVAGDTIEVLNKEFLMGPRAAERLCRALFRAFPGTRRIHLEVMFPPWEFKLPKQVLYWTDHMIVDLPDTVDAYLASLGRPTRKNVRRLGRRLRKEHSDTVVEMGSLDELEELVDLFVAWKNARFNARGKLTVWQRLPNAHLGLAEMVRRRGHVRVTRVDGRPAAVSFCFPVGTSLYLLQTGFDPAYEPYSLGLLDTYADVADAITKGYREVSMLWGKEDDKIHLGCRPRRATRLSVFRTQTDRLHFLDEAREVAWRNLRRNGQREYWRARHAAGRVARRFGIRTPGDRARQADQPAGAASGGEHRG